jgi:biotin-(acetyl-CoA carboxylase) ligase
VLAAFEERDGLRGRQLTWGDGDEGGSGIAQGIDDRGNLIVERDDGATVTLGSGEVHLQVN